MELNQIPEEYLPPPFTPTLVFKDESIINGSGGYNETSDDLWIWIDDPMGFDEAVAWFYNNPEKTDVIVINRSSIDSQTLEHYTRLVNIEEGPNGTKRIRLKR